MQATMIKKLSIFIILSLCLVFTINTAIAGSRFSSNYPCSDQGKICVSSGMRVVDGFEVSRPCWEWSYVKTCQYPSKNDCRLYEHCYDLGTKECLLKDSLGNSPYAKTLFSRKFTSSFIDAIFAATNNLYLIAK